MNAKQLHHVSNSVGSCHAAYALMIIRRVLFLCTLLSAPLAFSADISGTWKHAKNPAWIEIRLEEGSGTVVRNDKFPDRVGRKVLKDLQADNSHSQINIFSVHRLLAQR